MDKYQILKRPNVKISKCQYAKMTNHLNGKMTNANAKMTNIKLKTVKKTKEKCENLKNQIEKY